MTTEKLRRNVSRDIVPAAPIDFSATILLFACVEEQITTTNKTETTIGTPFAIEDFGMTIFVNGKCFSKKNMDKNYVINHEVLRNPANNNE